MAGDDADVKIEDPKCPFCRNDWDEEHAKREKKKCSTKCGKSQICTGQNVGTGGALKDRIVPNSQAKSAHPLIQSQSPKYKYKAGDLQAHHLICSEALNNEKWARICMLSGYNINCFKNGVFLPGNLKIACSAEVPLHISNHSDGLGEDALGASVNYPQAVRDKIDSVLKEYNNSDCTGKNDDMEQFVADMNTKSAEIFGYVRSFTWIITKDGFDYQPNNPIGCAGRSMLAHKTENTIWDSQENILKGIEKIKEIEKKRQERLDFYNKIETNFKDLKCSDDRCHGINRYNLQLGK
mgnify:CR=1 FL=1